MDYGMIDPLPFNVVYNYSYDGNMRAFEGSCGRVQRTAGCRRAAVSAWQ
jgi:hypothetical protein